MHQLTELPNPGDLKPTQEEWEQYMRGRYGDIQALDLLLNAIHDNPSAIDSPEYGYIAGYPRKGLEGIVRSLRNTVALEGAMSVLRYCIKGIKEEADMNKSQMLTDPANRAGVVVRDVPHAEMPLSDLQGLPQPWDVKPTQEEWEQYMTSKYGGSQALELILNAIHDNPSAVDSPEYGFIAGHSRRELGVLVRCSSVATHGRMSLDNTVQRCLADIKAAGSITLSDFI